MNMQRLALLVSGLMFASAAFAVPGDEVREAAKSMGYPLKVSITAEACNEEQANALSASVPQDGLGVTLVSRSVTSRPLVAGQAVQPGSVIQGGTVVSSKWIFKSAQIVADSDLQSRRIQQALTDLMDKACSVDWTISKLTVPAGR
ncbi:MAG: hypothetical protein V4634_00460 [Pseudomonadota bacterium]